MLSGADSGALGRALARRRRRARGRARRAARALRSRAASTSRCSAAACRATRRTCAPPSSSPRDSRCRSSRPTRSSSSAPTTTRRTRRGSASPTARCSPTRAASSASAASSTSRSQAQMEALFADLPSALANSVEIAKRCNMSLVLGKPQLPDFETPLVDGARVPMAEYFRVAAHDGPRGATGPALSRRGRARARAAALRRAPRLRDRDDPEDGLPGLLPDRRRLHQLGADATAARSAPGAARAPARWSRTRSTSPASIRCATSCCSSASSIPSGCRCPTSTSTSARPTAIASSTT